MMDLAACSATVWLLEEAIGGSIGIPFRRVIEAHALVI
jgi:hypothetical protein